MGQRDNLQGPGTPRTGLYHPGTARTIRASQRSSLTVRLPTYTVALRFPLLISRHEAAAETERACSCEGHENSKSKHFLPRRGGNRHGGKWAVVGFSSPPPRDLGRGRQRSRGLLHCLERHRPAAPDRQETDLPETQQRLPCSALLEPQTQPNCIPLS